MNLNGQVIFKRQIGLKKITSIKKLQQKKSYGYIDKKWPQLIVWHK